MNQPLSLNQVYHSLAFKQAVSSVTAPNDATKNAAVVDIHLQKPPANLAKNAVLHLPETPPKKANHIQYQYWGLSLAIHLLAIYLVGIVLANTPPTPKAAVPIMVSLVAPPTPEAQPAVPLPSIAPKPEPVVKKIAKTPKVSPKKIVKTVAPVINQDQPTIEPSTEPVVAEVAQPAQATEPVVSEVAETQAAPSAKLVAKAAEPAEKVEPPKFGVAYLNNPAPDYPGMSRRIGEQGRVLLKVLVSADGTAETVQLEQTSGSDRLDQAAINAVKRWRFVPAQLAGKALSAYVLVPVKFSLDS